MKLTHIYTEPTLDWLAALNTLLEASGGRAYREAKYPICLADITPSLWDVWKKARLTPIECNGGKFSVLGLAWVAILKEISAFGLKTDALQNLKETLYEPIGRTHLNILFFSFLLASLHPEENVYVTVPSNGTALAGLAGDIFYNQSIGTIPTEAVVLNLNQIWLPLFPSIKVKQQTLCSLKRGELELIGNLRTSSASEISVKRGPAGISHISEFFESQPGGTDLAALAKGVEFGEVSVKIKDGKVVYIKTENKKKIQ